MNTALMSSVFPVSVVDISMPPEEVGDIGIVHIFADAVYIVQHQFCILYRVFCGKILPDFLHFLHERYIVWLEVERKCGVRTKQLHVIIKGHF